MLLMRVAVTVAGRRAALAAITAQRGVAGSTADRRSGASPMSSIMLAIANVSCAVAVSSVIIDG
jgi:hypothetical protein